MRGTSEDPPWLTEAELMRRRGDRVSQAGGRWRVKLVEWGDRYLPIGFPWCGLFVAHCLRTAEPSLGLPFLQMRARPWRRFGTPCEPQVGALLVFWMLAKPSPLGHVGFYVAEDDACFHVLGGNEHDTITVERWPKERLIACRWPSQRTAPAGERRHRDPDSAAGFEFGTIL